MASKLLSHLNKIKIPSKDDKIYKDECAYCFDTPESESGLFISMCTSPFLCIGKKFVEPFSQRTGATVFLHIKRLKHEIETTDESELQNKPTRLAIGVPGGFDTNEKKYEFEDLYSIVLLPDWDEFPLSFPDLPDKVLMSANAIVAADSAARRAELEAMETSWDGVTRLISKYAPNLQQLPATKKVSPTGWKCERCDKTDNLWLNLTDGSILCGRQNWDGSGGNNHAAEHYDRTKYPLAVKLGTITPEGADVYSYPEDEMVLDPNLSLHLNHFGIDIMNMTKTDKTMAELELDINQRTWEWSLLQESGSQLQLIHGPGLTGMHNTGNSCYINSVMQVLLTMPQFVDRYYKPAQQIFSEAQGDPNTNISVQLAKLAHGLLSGEYSKPTSGPDAAHSVVGIRPQVFRTLIGENHREFSTKRQQDAQEYLLHVLCLVERNCRGSNNPTDAIKFRVEDRIECTQSHKVKYNYRDEYMLAVPIPLEAASNKEEVAAYELEKARLESEGKPTGDLEVVRPRIALSSCMEALASPSFVDDFYSSAIDANTTARKTMRLASFPDYLFLHMQKFTVGSDWVERKLDLSVDMPDVIDITPLRGHGKQANEELLPERQAESAKINVDQIQVTQLVEMGFPHNACIKAVYFTKNAGIEEAMNWVMAHMDDLDYDQPLVLNSAGGKSTENDQFMPDSAAVEMIVGMGFSQHQATVALKATDNILERAIDWIFSHPDELNAPADSSAPQAPAAAAASQLKYSDGSGRYRLLAFISHMGTSSKAGHYVCHIQKDGRWVIFNDEKVALSEKPPKDLGYIYLYERI